MKKNNIAIIPARGGSKRLPNKNILSFCGEPLIARTVKTALESQCVDKIVITSDSNTVLKCVSDIMTNDNKKNKEIIYLKRPDYLATDVASQIDVIEHVITTLGSSSLKSVILLQPTSPLRTSKDIDSAYELFKKDTFGSVISFGELNHPTTYSTIINSNGNVDDFITYLSDKPKRSQEFEQEYRLNGAIYIFPVRRFMDEKNIFLKPCRAYLMSYESSFDIDEEIDFKICEFLAYLQDKST